MLAAEDATNAFIKALAHAPYKPRKEETLRFDHYSGFPLVLIPQANQPQASGR